MNENPHSLTWLRSRYCSDNACAEVAVDGEVVHLRNSERPDQVVTLSAAEWAALRRGILDGQF